MRKIRNYAAIAGLAFLISISSAAKTNPLEANKAVARRLFEVALNHDNWDVYNEIHGKDFVAHAGKRSAGLAEDLQDAQGWRQAFPDGQYTVDQVIAEGDRVVVQYTGRGTNTGTGNGLPATGKHVEVTGVTIFRIAHGKIVEEWSQADMLGLLRQLGLAPARGQ
ncbi:MAG: ester cyclase [Terriglobales bacterium]